MKKLLASAAFAAVAVAGTAGTANAQVVAANNLVNVQVTGTQVVLGDLVDVNAAVAVPIGIAANVCDVSAAVLAEQLDAGGTECDADTSQRTRQGLSQIERFAATN